MTEQNLFSWGCWPLLKLQVHDRCDHWILMLNLHRPHQHLHVQCSKIINGRKNININKIITHHKLVATPSWPSSPDIKYKIRKSTCTLKLCTKKPGKIPNVTWFAYYTNTVYKSNLRGCVWGGGREGGRKGHDTTKATMYNWLTEFQLRGGFRPKSSKRRLRTELTNFMVQCKFIKIWRKPQLWTTCNQ